MFKIEACDLRAGQTVLHGGKSRKVERVKVDSGSHLSVEIKFEDADEPFMYGEGDFFLLQPLVKLQDHGDGGEPGFDKDGVNVFITADERWIWIRPEGYGEQSAEDGHGFPIGLEYYNGRLRLIAYSDINEADPQIIDMEGARETNRKD